MKKNKRLTIAVILLVPLLAVSVWAKVSAVTAPQTPKPGSTFKQRLAQRKLERNIKLAKVDQQRLIDKCSSVQTQIRVIETKAAPIVTNHQNVYAKIDAKLWVEIGQLKLASQDTFKLEKQRAQLATLASDFKTTAANYQQALDDMTVINCQSDVIGFKALLDTTRLYYKQLIANSAAISQYLINTVKPTLTDYSTALQPNINTSN